MGLMNRIASESPTCFCGASHETAVCRYCNAPIMRHEEPGLMGWFAFMVSPRTYANGDCSRNAMNAMHAPAPTEDESARRKAATLAFMARVDGIMSARGVQPTQSPFVRAALANKLPAKELGR